MYVCMYVCMCIYIYIYIQRRGGTAQATPTGPNASETKFGTWKMDMYI